MRALLLLALLAAPARAQDEARVPPPAAEPDRSRPVPPAPARPVEMPEARRARLANGIALSLVPGRRLPIVALRIVLPRAGDAYDPEGMEGLADLTARLLTAGTLNRDGLAFAHAREELGASIGSSSWEEGTSITVYALRDQLDPVMALVAEAIRRPALDEAELERERTDVLMGIRRRGETAAGSITARSRERVYGDDHPYSWSMTEESVSALTARDLREFHARAYSPRGMVIAAAGDVELEELRELAERHFGDWTETPETAAFSPSPRPVPAPDVRARAEPGDRAIELHDRPGAVQSLIVVSQAALEPSHPDFHAFQVAVEILGGHNIQGRLGANLRERRGWAYGTSAGTAVLRGGAALIVQAPVQTDRTAESLAEVLAEMRRMTEEDVSPGELEGAKSRLVTSAVRGLETVQSVASRLAGMELGDRPADYMTVSRERYLAVTVADVRRAAAAYFRPEEAAITVDGDAARVREGLERLRPVRLIDGEGRPVGPNG